MNNVKFSQFIIVDNEESLRSHRTCKSVQIGYIIYPINVPVPIIVKGVGCVGYGTIRKIFTDGNTTEIGFEYSHHISQQVADAYYDLYRNTLSEDSEDAYDNAQDAFIPGANYSSRRSSSKAYKKNLKPSSSIDDLMEKL